MQLPDRYLIKRWFTPYRVRVAFLCCVPSERKWLDRYKSENLITFLLYDLFLLHLSLSFYFARSWYPDGMTTQRSAWHDHVY